MQRLKAVILIGGPGTRLQPLTDDTPKSMVPVLNKPFMEHTIAYLKQFGIEDIILTLNYLPEVVQGYFGDGSRFGVRLTYCVDGASIENAVLWNNVRIGANARLSQCIISSDTSIEPNTRIVDYVVTPSQVAPLSRPSEASDKLRLKERP